jgi:hypothetical protein
MNSKIFILVLIVLVLFFSGCGKRTQTGTEIKTCAELNGDICESGEHCEGNLLSASDAIEMISSHEGKCCSIECTAINSGSNEWDDVELPGFDFGTYDDDFGDLNG